MTNKERFSHQHFETISNRILTPLIRTQQLITTQAEKHVYFPREAKRIKEQFPDIKSALDIGCGTGYFGSELKKEMPEVAIISTDIENRIQTDEAFAVADMNQLPFSDKSFDLVTFMYVLHHTSTPSQALEEAKRLSKRSILIQEDVFNNKLQEEFYRFHLNSYCLTITSDGLHPWTELEWEELFNQHNLVINSKRYIHKIIGYPVGRCEYILDIEE